MDSVDTTDSPYGSIRNGSVNASAEPDTDLSCPQSPKDTCSNLKNFKIHARMKKIIMVYNSAHLIAFVIEGNDQHETVSVLSLRWTAE